MMDTVLKSPPPSPLSSWEGEHTPSPSSGEGWGGGRVRVPKEKRLVLKQHARRLRHEMTDAERKLWQVLRARQCEGMRFCRQMRLDNYIVDFVCLERKLIIELDGGQHALQSGYDGRRDAYLQSQGFRLIRFWNHEVMANLEGVMMAVRSALTPTLPSPERGEG